MDLFAVHDVVSGGDGERQSDGAHETGAQVLEVGKLLARFSLLQPATRVYLRYKIVGERNPARKSSVNCAALAMTSSRREMVQAGDR